MKLSILIVSFNVERHLRACLSSLEQAPEAEIVVVDNASNDGSAAMTRQHFPRAVVDAQYRNLGFARAINRAASLASGDVFLILNPDTELADGSVAAMCTALREHPESSVMGFRQVDAQGRFQIVTGRRPTLWRELGRRSRQRQRDAGRLNEAAVPSGTGDVDWVSASVMMVRREAFERVGGFDESYFLYFEDVDFCLRIAEQGGCVLYDPSVTVTHHRGASGDGRTTTVKRLYRRSQLEFARRYFDPASLFILESYLRLNRQYPER